MQLCLTNLRFDRNLHRLFALKQNFAGEVVRSSFDRRFRIVRSPGTWGIRVRRLFLLSLPVAVIVWLGLLLLMTLASLWRDLWMPLHRMWNAAPRKPEGEYWTYRTAQRAGKSDAQVVDIGPLVRRTDRAA